VTMLLVTMVTLYTINGHTRTKGPTLETWSLEL
jgi:hypothetical protein